MGLAYGVGISPVFGGGRLSTLWSFDYTSAPYGQYNDLTTLSYTNATAVRSYQSGVGSVGFINAINKPVISTIDGVNRGLLIEERRTNAFVNARSLAGWSLFSGTVTDGQLGVDGTNVAHRHQGDNTQKTKYKGITGLAVGTYCGSAFHRTDTSSNVRLATYSRLIYAASSSTFKRNFVLDPNVTSITWNPFLAYGKGDYGQPAEAFDVVVDAPQFEAGRYPTSFIDGTRAGGGFNIPAHSIANGRLIIEFTVQMICSCGGSNDSTADIRLICGGVSPVCTVTIAKNTGIITVSIGASSATFDAFTWSYGEVLSFRLLIGGASAVTSIWAKRASSEWIWLGDSASAQGALDGSTMYNFLYDQTNIEATDATSPRQCPCLLMSAAAYRLLETTRPISSSYSGDRSVASKIMSGDKISLLTMGDSRQNFLDLIYARLWTDIPLSGIDLPLYAQTGVVRPWTATWYYTNIDTPVLLGDGVTYLGNTAPFSCLEAITSAGTVPVDSPTRHGIPLLPDPSIAYNPYTLNMAKLQAAFQADPADVYYRVMVQRIPTGHVGCLKIQLRPDALVSTEAGSIRSDEFGSYAAVPDYQLISVKAQYDPIAYPAPALELIGAPGATITTGKTIRIVRSFVERGSYGITTHNCAVGGRSLAGVLSANVWSPALWSSVVSNLSGEKILWLDLGTNDGAISVAAHKANVATMISNFRAAIPNGKVLLTTAYPRSTDTPGIRPNWAQAMWETAADAGPSGNILCIDTHLSVMTYVRASALGLMADTVHYSNTWNDSTTTGAAYFAKKINDMMKSLG